MQFGKIEAAGVPAGVCAVVMNYFIVHRRKIKETYSIYLVQDEEDVFPLVIQPVQKVLLRFLLPSIDIFMLPPDAVNVFHDLINAAIHNLFCY